MRSMRSRSAMHSSSPEAIDASELVTAPHRIGAGEPVSLARRVFGAVGDDAASLAHAVEGSTSRRAILKTILANDSFAILLLWRLRQAARRYRIAGLNTALRRIQTAVYGIELGNAVTLGTGVYFVHPVG